MMRVSEMPPSERPAQRMLHIGPTALSTHELLCVVIGGIKQGDAAESLLTHYQHSLRILAGAPLKQYEAFEGIGEAAAVRIAASIELGRRFCTEVRDELMPVRSPRDIAAYASPKYEDLPVEHFRVLMLDAQHRLVKDILITKGILTSTLVHPREVFREVIAHAAAAVILLHNHPSGDPTPSADDRAVTEQLVAAGKLLDIPVRDHVIIGRGRFVSFAEAGLM